MCGFALRLASCNCLPLGAIENIVNRLKAEFDVCLLSVCAFVPSIVLSHHRSKDTNENEATHGVLRVFTFIGGLTFVGDTESQKIEE